MKPWKRLLWLVSEVVKKWLNLMQNKVNVYMGCRGAKNESVEMWEKVVNLI